MVEKSNKWAVIVIWVLIIGVLLGAGCVSETPQGESGKSSASDGSLSEFLDKVESTTSTSFKYDQMKLDGDGNEYKSKIVWEKGSKMRCQLVVKGEASDIYILDRDQKVAYHYVPETSRAREVDFNLARTMAGEPISETVQTFIESYEEAGLPSIESETIDGKVCTVLGMSAPGAGEKKMWIWQEYGLPIREEMTTHFGTSVTEMKNIELDPIPDSMFELPAGAEIVE